MSELALLPAELAIPDEPEEAEPVKSVSLVVLYSDTVTLKGPASLMDKFVTDIHKSMRGDRPITVTITDTYSTCIQPSYIVRIDIITEES